ncbi:MAG: hypothetical protein IJF32_07555, partial [Oscillospiraceae bacterium]|nr:hypothetical protein [Oscillospiraceae bacterium]
PDYADYTFTYDFMDTPVGNNTELTSPVLYTDTQGMWSSYEKSRETMQIIKTGDGLRIRTSAGYWASFKINVPVGGKYKVVLNHMQLPVATTTKAGYGNIYLLDGSTQDVASALESAMPINGETPIAYVSSEITDGKSKAATTILDKEYEIESGEYILVFRSTGQYPGCHSESGTYPSSFVLQGDEVGSAYAGVVTVTTDELKVNDTTPAAANIWNTADGSSVSAYAVFASNNTAVSVDGNTLTADSVGKAKISATVSELNPISIVPAEVIVVDSTDDSVTFGVYSNIGDGVEFEVNGNLKRGDKVTLTAENVPGYNFVGWKRGNSVTGKLILDAPQENFEYKIYSNAFITAIYEEANPTDAVGVELWNKNGELVAEYTATEFEALSELPAAEMIGYTFNGWETANGEAFTLESELGNGITRAVAKYTANAVGEYTYSEPITYNKSKSGFSSWLRDGRVVSYSSPYTYYVFKVSDVEENVADVPEDKKPLVVLDEGHGAYMIEYDSADYNIVEAGIVASNSGTPTVGSAHEKHIAQGKNSHGQFAVKLTKVYSKVRGYVIYLDGTDYKIVYSD